jgi:hypothetical protein
LSTKHLRLSLERRSVSDYAANRELAMNWQPDRFTTPTAENVHSSLCADNIRLPTVKFTARFAWGFIQCAAYSTQHIVDSQLGIFKRRKPPFHPYARHSKILQFYRLVVAIPQCEKDPVPHFLSQSPFHCAPNAPIFDCESERCYRVSA